MNRAQIARRCLLAGLVAYLPLPGQSLTARLANGHLRVSAPQLRFLTGKVLERLHDGAPVVFAFQLSLSTDGLTSVWLRDVARFVISYDLWEEKYAVMRLGRPGAPASRLSAEAAQDWCVDALALPVSDLAEQKPFWVKLEARVEDPKQESGANPESPVSLARLIELFSRQTRSQQERWVAQAGPLRLAELKKPLGCTR